MRKITELAVAAFLKSESFRLANTSVHVDETEVRLKLHGNTIAKRNRQTGVIEITTSGWDTPTTKARLNGLPGVHVYTRVGQLYLNGSPWDGEWAVLFPTHWISAANYYNVTAKSEACWS